MSDLTANDWKDLTKTVTGMALLPLTVFVDCWGLAKLWAWYAVPIFGWRAITKREALGLAMIWAVFIYRHKSGSTKDFNPVTAQLVSIAMTFLFVLAGWFAR